MSKINGAAAAENTTKRFASFREIADFLWQNAERLRGAYKPNEYDKVILPLLVTRRLDCVLGPTKGKVLARLDALKAKGMKPSDPAVDVTLRKLTGVPFYNTSKLDFAKLPVSRHFYEYKALRPLAVIEGEIRALEKEIQGLLGEVLA